MDQPQDLRYRIERYEDGTLCVTATCPPDPDDVRMAADLGWDGPARGDWQTITVAAPTLPAGGDRIAVGTYRIDGELTRRAFADLGLEERASIRIGPHRARVVIADLPADWRDNPLVDTDIPGPMPDPGPPAAHAFTR